jgi:class 3 adenylate cyclase
MEIPSVQAWERLGLDAFVPVLLRRQLADRRSAPLQPRVHQLPAALLLADVSGFTSLAESFARRGPGGAEQLRDVLNFFCGHLSQLVEAHGGEVFRFAGDAALALWIESDHSSSATVHRAALCGLAAQRLFRDTAAPYGVVLQVRIGVGAGDLWFTTVGGVDGRWEFLMGGEPLSQATIALEMAGPGETAVSPTAWAVLSTRARAAAQGERSVRLESVAPCQDLRPVPASLPVLAEAAVRAYVAPSIQMRLDARQSEWLAEFRRVTVVLVNFGAVDCTVPSALEAFQRMTVMLQAAVFRYEGSINQLLVDDKGTVALCSWGLALHVHGDDQVRAVRAVLELRQEFRQAGFRAAFGVATGEVFTGLIGTTRRCEYALIGDVVNVAARLMQAVDDDALCDAGTREAGGRKIAFDALPPLRVKGRARAVEVFRPTHVLPTGNELLGRVRERQLLRDRLDALLDGSLGGGVALIEGDAGIGKSRLVADVIERATTAGIRMFLTAGDAIERAAPYQVWCPVFDHLLGLAHSNGRRGAEDRVLRVLERNPALLPFAPLLNPVLRLTLPETEQSRHAPPRGRAALTRDLLVYLLREATECRPTLLVIEDAHWLDSNSWELAEAIVQQLSHVLLLLVVRPSPVEQESAELRRLRGRTGAVVVSLDVLAPDHTRALVSQRLRAYAVDDDVADLVHARTEGHPFFVEELVHALRDGGLLTVEQGLVRFSGSAAAVKSLQLPATIQVIVTSRIDQLPVPHQLTVKVASVFGRSFDLDGLGAVYPIAISPEELGAHLASLVERDLVHPAASSRGTGYEFKHALTQEVVYRLLPFALRRQLHASCAQWYERTHQDNLAPLFPLLAHHWSRADAAERAVFYLERSGEQAFARHANEEANRFFTEALEIDRKTRAGEMAGRASSVPQPPSDFDDVRRARWLRYLGETAINLGRWDEGRRHLERSLVLSGFPLPTTRAGWIVGLGAQVLRQALHRMGGARFRRTPRANPDVLHEVIRVYGRVGANAYFSERMDQVFYTLVSALNLGERAGPTSELALAFADVGNIFGLAPIRPLARLYHRLAAQTAGAVPDRLTRARISGRTAVYHLAVGNWAVCGDLRAAMAICDEFGDSYAWEENAAFLARALQLQGDFETAAGLGGEIRRRAAASGSSAHEIWGFAAEVWGTMYQGHLDTALALAEQGLGLVATTARTDRLAKLDLLGAKALAHLYRREWMSARSAVEQIGAVLDQSARPRYFSTLYLSAAVEAALVLQEIEPAPTQQAEMAARARYLCRQLELYARINPPAQARALLWRGCLQWLTDDRQRAQRSWTQALAAAERFTLPYETARIHFEIGRRLPPTDPTRRNHLDTAEEEFRRLGANADVTRVRSIRETYPTHP